MKARFPALGLAVNGGVESLEEAAGFLARGLDGVMIGRAAYHAPALLGAADRTIFGAATPDVAAEDAVAAMLPYIEAERSRGTPLNAITRHMLGAFQGRPGARAWRRRLSEGAHLAGAGPELVRAALGAVGRLIRCAGRVRAGAPAARSRAPCPCPTSRSSCRSWRSSSSSAPSPG